MKEIAVSEYKSREFAGSLGRGAMIRYQDDQGANRTCLVYLMTGPTFAGYSTIEYLDADQLDVLPRARKTLDSIRALPMKAPMHMRSRPSHACSAIICLEFDVTTPYAGTDRCVTDEESSETWRRVFARATRTARWITTGRKIRRLGSHRGNQAP